MKRLVTLFIYFISICFPVALPAAGYSVDNVPNVHVADRTRFVTNPDGILTSSQQAALDQILSEIWNKTSAEVVVVAVDDIDSDDPDLFATKLFEKWGIGKEDNDNGLLILLAKNQHKIVMRTGQGMEGVLPDVICGRLIRQYAIPYFKNEDYAGGLESLVTETSRIVTNPEYADELRSRYENDSRRVSQEDGNFFDWYFSTSIAVGVICLIVALIGIVATRRQLEYKRVHTLTVMRYMFIFLTVLFLAMPLVAMLVVTIAIYRIRNHKRLCPNCSTPMKKLDEATDNLYLTPAQDVEEQIKSVDYDVWQCPNCNELDIIPFENPNSSYTRCPRCGAKACTLTSDRVVTRPTSRSKGVGEKTFTCLNCRNTTTKRYSIEALASAAPIVIGGLGSLGGSRGGGLGGGSFGGGGTMGGGASGSW